MDRLDDLALCLKNIIRKEVDGEDGLEIRLHVDGADDWWLNTGCPDYDSIHGKWITSGTLYPDTNPDEMARKLWEDIEDLVAMAGANWRVA